MRRQVIVGEAFETLKASEDTKKTAEVILANTNENESRTRSNLAYGAAAGGGVFILISGVMGIYDGSFNELQSVWNVLGPLIGAVFAHYFGGSGKMKQNDHSKEG